MECGTGGIHSGRFQLGNKIDWRGRPKGNRRPLRDALAKRIDVKTFADAINLTIHKAAAGDTRAIIRAAEVLALLINGDRRGKPRPWNTKAARNRRIKTG